MGYASVDRSDSRVLPIGHLDIRRQALTGVQISIGANAIGIAIFGNRDVYPCGLFPTFRGVFPQAMQRPSPPQLIAGVNTNNRTIIQCGHLLELDIIAGHTIPTAIQF